MGIKFHDVCYVVGALLIIVGIAAYYYEGLEWIFAAYPWSRIWLIFVGCLLITVGIIRHAFLERNVVDTIRCASCGYIINAKYILFRSVITRCPKCRSDKLRRNFFE